MSVYEDIMAGLNEAMEAKRRMETFSGLLFSGLVKHDISGMGGELIASAGDLVYGYLNYCGSVPYILGQIEDVCDEYVAPEYWFPVRPESVKLLINGNVVPIEDLAALV